MSFLEHPAVDAFDVGVDRLFDRPRTHPAVNRAMYSLTELGDFSLIWHTISVATGLLGGPQGQRKMVRLSLALGVEAALVNGPVKSRFRRQRPVHEGLRPHTLRLPQTSSFPSGHASAAACAVVLLTDGAEPPVKAAWVTLGALVALSRIHVRIHHASDVVGGALVGTAAGLIARRLFPLR